MVNSSATYISGRKKFVRPQALLWSNNTGSTSNGIVYPTGEENEDFIILSDHNRSEISITQQRIENRQRMINGSMRSYHIADKINLAISWNRLPSRSFATVSQFTESGQILTAQKFTQMVENSNSIVVDSISSLYVGMSVNGNGIQSGTKIAALNAPTLNVTLTKNCTTTTNDYVYFSAEEYTADGGAGGVQLLDWYENHTGPFYVYLSYDKYNNFKINNEIDGSSYQHLNIYNDIRLMYFSSFEYIIEKRGQGNFDFWNISVSLEEV